jgi:succinate-semialdehyde dehydrogenase/glutarate-semialdehyde dehydrogenase
MMAGNGTVMKLSSNVPGCALAIEQVFREAGFPKDLSRTLLIGSARVGAVIESPLVRAVTLTGSGAAGRALASKAGSLLKKTVLELEGSDPYLVLEDADLNLAATVCARGRLTNWGTKLHCREAIHRRLQDPRPVCRTLCQTHGCRQNGRSVPPGH